MPKKGYRVIDNRRKFTARSDKFTKTGVAPLVQTDINELGDRRLDPRESVIREREEILKIESRKRIHGQDELEKAERSEGAKMAHTEIMRRLQRINPGIHAKPGIPGNLALYSKKRQDEYTEDDTFILNSPIQAELMGLQVPKDMFFIHHKYITGFPEQELPEWGHVTNDTSLIAHREIRGWRSVLIAFIKAGIISYTDAVKEFGDPSGDQRSQFWFEQVGRFRK